ncbi:MAG TPA: response regulator [Luteitalea sp.]|nr:response regulator [Luteitalea sp.]
MPAAPIPVNEDTRIAALRRYEILDTPPEESFDRFTRLASSILGTPMSLISLVDESRQWFKSSTGVDVRETPRDRSFCAHTILSSGVLVVPDATRDSRFADNPLVTGAPGIRFYAAAPLTSPDGERIGTLCVLDDQPHDGLAPGQIQQLQDLAAIVVTQLELRRQTATLEDNQRLLEAHSAATESSIEAIREREQRYLVLFHENPQPMWVYDLATLSFLDVNAAAVAMYGYTREEFLARTILDIRPADEVERTRQAAHSVPPTVHRSGPWRHVRKDGSLNFVRVSSYPTHFEGREARLVLVTDITDEKRLEEQLIQAQKMEAVGQLAGGIAHDFNNLLTVINGYAQLLISRLHESDPLRVDAGHVLQAGERAAALTQQLLAFSRRQVLQPRALNVADIIEGLRPMLGRLLRENIDVRTTLPPTLPPVMVDPVQLEQVLLNLAINGSDAMPDGGTLTITAGQAQVDADMAARQGVAEGPYVTLTVADTGVGIDEDAIGRIFEPFFTTKPTGRGSGLGLPVADGIVTQSGGTIVVRSRPGHGSTFTVYLPLGAASVTEDSEPASADTAHLEGHETVLVVEDHEAVRRLAADVLKAHGYQVLVADHGLEAIDIVEARGGRVDLLVTDVIMPRMSGREVATALQQRVPDLAVLFMSGYTETAIVQNGALEAGLQFLAKPFTPGELLARVRSVLSMRPGHPPAPVAHLPTRHAERPAVAESFVPTSVVTSTTTYEPVRRPRRVVVADDEPGLRLLLSTTLVGAGYEVLQATNGLEAVRLCESGGVDLLLTDLVMPGQEGLETIKRMRHDRPDIPIVAMSGAFDGGFLEVARTMGASAVIQKPFTPDQVIKVVGRVLGGESHEDGPIIGW